MVVDAVLRKREREKERESEEESACGSRGSGRGRVTQPRFARGGARRGRRPQVEAEVDPSTRRRPFPRPRRPATPPPAPTRSHRRNRHLSTSLLARSLTCSPSRGARVQWETEKANLSGNSSSRRRIKVPFPTPEGPVTTRADGVVVAEALGPPPPGAAASTERAAPMGGERGDKKNHVWVFDPLSPPSRPCSAPRPPPARSRVLSL